MQLPKQVQELCAKSLKVVILDSEHKLNPHQRLAIYKSFGGKEDPQIDRVFLNLQILTAEYVLTLWKKAEPLNSLAEDLLIMARQVLNHTVVGEELKETLQKVWEELDIAAIDGAYDDKAFAGVCAAFETLRMAIYGFDGWVDLELEETDTDDDTAQWGNDSAKWASIAVADRPMNSTPINNEKRLEFWKWWLKEAIPQAWTLI